MIRCLFVFQPMVRVRDSPQCAICEFVMKELETTLEDQKTEVGSGLLMYPIWLLKKKNSNANVLVVHLS